MRLPFEEIESRLFDINIKLGFDDENARLIANTHTQSNCDGVESHGVNRYPRFVEYVQAGHVRVNGDMELMDSMGAIERWDGHQRAGILNAFDAMERAIMLSGKYGLGAVALRNTNHWMRAGTYGWFGVEHGCVSICMTNTIPNMVPWGGQKKAIGNNPIVLAVPRREGAVVLDMAVSQFSYGKIEDSIRKGQKLPYLGGWDGEGHLTNDPASILDGGQVLPAGLWKGSGLSILTDMVVSLLSGGRSSHSIGQRTYETDLSQLFLCIDVNHPSYGDNYQSIADDVIQSIHSSVSKDGKVYYPGERTLIRRTENMIKGVPVDEEVWKKIRSLPV